MMVERKVFKTKLCVLYQKGRCSRSSCSFAHGSRELRRFPVSYGGSRDCQGGDVMDKLERRYSPLQGRDTRGRHGFREYSSSRSRERQGKRRKQRQADGQSDFSGSLRNRDRSEEQSREGKVTSSTSRDVLDDQLKEVQSDIAMAEHRKYQLGVYLDEKVQEAGNLSSRIQELESQLHKEKEECKRTTSKIKKFIKAHNRCSRIQDELKRSQVRLQKLGDQLVSDVSRIDANEEDSSVNIMSDGETAVLPVIRRPNDIQKNASPRRKGQHANRDTAEEPKLTANLSKGHQEQTMRLKRLSRWNAHPSLSIHHINVDAMENGTNGRRPIANESKHKRGKTLSTSTSHVDKLRGLESGLVPSISMAAHALDEDIDIELEDRTEVVRTASVGNKTGATYETIGLELPLPPPPPNPPTNYPRYAGGEKNIAVKGLEEEMVNVDINVV